MKRKKSITILLAAIGLTALISFIGYASPSLLLSGSGIIQRLPNFKQFQPFKLAPSCNRETVGYDYDCLEEHLQYISSKHSVKVVQANSAFIPIVLNLLCSAKLVGISPESFVIWSMDNATHHLMLTHGLMSIYNPDLYFGVSSSENYHTESYIKMMRSRALFWKTITSIGVPLWWIDSDVFFSNPFDFLLSTDDALNSDIVFQLDYKFSNNIAFPDRQAQVKYWVEKNESSPWQEACGGLFYVKPSVVTREFFEKIDQLLNENDSIEDQQAINLILNSEWAGFPEQKRNFTFSFFDSKLVPNGHVAFCKILSNLKVNSLEERLRWRSEGKVVISHLNGKSAKIKLLKEELAWFLDDEYICKS